MLEISFYIKNRHFKDEIKGTICPYDFDSNYLAQPSNLIPYYRKMEVGEAEILHC